MSLSLLDVDYSSVIPAKHDRALEVRARRLFSVKHVRNICLTNRRPVGRRVSRKSQATIWATHPNPSSPRTAGGNSAEAAASSMLPAISTTLPCLTCVCRKGPRLSWISARSRVPSPASDPKRASVQLSEDVFDKATAGQAFMSYKAFCRVRGCILRAPAPESLSCDAAFPCPCTFSLTEVRDDRFRTRRWPSSPTSRVSLSPPSPTEWWSWSWTPLQRSVSLPS